jgi:hypothetical protein
MATAAPESWAAASSVALKGLMVRAWALPINSDIPSARLSKKERRLNMKTP